MHVGVERERERVLILIIALSVNDLVDLESYPTCNQGIPTLATSGLRLDNLPIFVLHRGTCSTRGHMCGRGLTSSSENVGLYLGRVGTKLFRVLGYKQTGLPC